MATVKKNTPVKAPVKAVSKPAAPAKATAKAVTPPPAKKEAPAKKATTTKQAEEKVHVHPESYTKGKSGTTYERIDTASLDMNEFKAAVAEGNAYPFRVRIFENEGKPPTEFAIVLVKNFVVMVDISSTDENRETSLRVNLDEFKAGKLVASDGTEVELALYQRVDEEEVEPAPAPKAPAKAPAKPAPKAPVRGKK